MRVQRRAFGRRDELEGEEHHEREQRDDEQRRGHPARDVIERSRHGGELRPHYRGVMPDVGTRAPRGAVRRLSAARDRVKRSRSGAVTYRIVVAVLGLAIIAVGIILLPLPGPGWLIIFAGLGVLATEFAWASRLLGYARQRVRRWTDWVQSRSRPVQALIGLLFLTLAGALAYAAWYVYLR
jgi:uncharacterized protein (TIGR02611 family)